MKNIGCKFCRLIHHLWMSGDVPAFHSPGDIKHLAFVNRRSLRCGALVFDAMHKSIPIEAGYVTKVALSQ